MKRKTGVTEMNGEHPIEDNPLMWPIVAYRKSMRQLIERSAEVAGYGAFITYPEFFAENGQPHPYEIITIGDEAEVSFEMTYADTVHFGRASHDWNSQHFKNKLIHGMHEAALVSGVLGTMLPGPGTIYVSQTLAWPAPAHIGDRLTVKLRVIEKSNDIDANDGRRKKRVTLTTQVFRQTGVLVLDGIAVVKPPKLELAS